MWQPILLDMSKLECKKSLRSLELEAYSMLVSAFRAQGDLNDKKLHILKELQIIFKISIDRHKAELRRATNDEKLYTIAKLLSRDDSVSNEWLKQSKRFIPLLPSLQNTNSYYRILADQILSKSEPIFNLYPDESNHSVIDEIEENKLNETEKEMNENEEDRNFLYLKNGYAVETKSVSIQNIQPSEYVKKFESINETNESNHSKSFLKYLIQKYKQQKDKEENYLINKTKQKLKQEENKSNKLLTTNKQQEVIIQDNLNNQNSSIIQAASLQQTLIPIQIPIQNQHQIKFTNHHHMIKLNNQTHNTATTTTTTTTTSTLVKLPNPTNQLTPKLLIPTKPSSKLIILPTTNQTTSSNTNIQTTQTTQTNNNNLKILTVQPTSLNLNQKILLNVPGLKSINQNTTKNFLNGNELINESYKRKLNDLGMNSVCNKNTKNLVCLKLDKFEEDSLVLNNNTSTNNNKNGYHHENDSNNLVFKQNGSSNKRIKLSDSNGTSLNINTNSNNSTNSTNSNSNEILTVTNLNSNSNSTND